MNCVAHFTGEVCHCCLKKDYDVLNYHYNTFLYCNFLLLISQYIYTVINISARL